MNREKGLLILVALLILFQAEIYCQKVLDPEFMPPDARFDNFQISGGDVSQTSTSILIDSRGFLWCGTESGLYRYDGARYVEFSYPGSGNLPVFIPVLRIFEDSQGTIWAGTSEGLNRVNQSSRSLQLYIPDSTGIRGNGNSVRSVHEDSDGLLWIRTGRNVFSFDRESGKFTKYLVDSLSWHSASLTFQTEEQCFLEDRQKNKWFVTAKGLYRLNKGTDNFRMIMPDPDDPGQTGIIKVKCITSDRNGTIWIGTEGSGLIRWNETTDKPEKIDLRPAAENAREFGTVSSLLTDNNGYVWAFGLNVFSRLKPDDNSVVSYKFLYKYQTVYEDPRSPVEVNQAFRFRDGTIWFFSRSAGLIYRFDPLSEKLSLYRTPTFVVFQCLADNDETLWFACVRNNVFRMVRTPVPYFTVFPVNNTADVAQTHKGSIIEDKSGRTWFLFNRGIYTVNNFNVSSSVRFNPVILPGGVTIATGGFADSKGFLWVVSKKGRILRYNPSSGSIFDLTPPDLPGDIRDARIPLIREDRSGNIWVVTVSNGLYRFNPDAIKLEYILDLNTSSIKKEMNWLLDFLIDSHNDLWILSSDHVLSVRMPDFTVRDYSGSGDISLTALNSNLRIREDASGNIWLLNAISGLSLFDRNESSFNMIKLPWDLSPASYYDFLVDSRGKFWLAHNRGISVFDPADSRIRMISMPRLQYDVQAYQLGNGNIIYVNDNQLYIFGENIPENTVIPPVRLTRLLVNGKDFGAASGTDDPDSLIKISLPYNRNSLRIEFASLNFLSPDENRYRFFMKGIDRDTVEANQGAAAEYRGMPPGNYIFWITGSNNDGIWNPVGVTLGIRIHPPWFRSVTAYIFYLVLSGFLLGAYVRYRTFNLKREKERLEAEVSARTAELETKNQQLAEIDRIKTTFFTDISHEIRTPLSLIMAPLESISREEVPAARIPELVGIMKRNAQRLMHMVNQLLDISRLDAGKMRIALTEEDIAKIIRIMVYEFLSLAESKKIHYLADLPEGEFITWFDRDKVEKIISNLLINAFRYTPPGGSVRCIVRIESDENIPGNARLHISVIDSGPGISNENQSRIFERFYRVEGHHETSGYGTGIGLSLVREFITMLHGTIEVSSTPGEGSEFSVSLPLGKGHLTDIEYVIIPPNAAGIEKRLPFITDDRYDSGHVSNQGKERTSILIIEDNEDLRNFIGKSLENEYRILEAENGKTGINTAFTMMPDLVVTDIMMPDPDGISLCTQLKNDERTSHIPIILLTARATADDRIEGLRSGADDYIVKPFNMTELKARISNLLILREKLRLKYGKLNTDVSNHGKVLTVDDRFMQKVTAIINENLNEFSFDVGVLQERLGMSRMHLSRKLKILTGYSPGIFIRNMRLEKAAELLSHKAGNITEVSNSVGMSNPSNFAKAFRTYFGVSPKNYSRN